MANLGSLLLAMETGLAIGLIVAALIIGAAVAVAITVYVLKKRAKKRSEQKLDETSRRVEEMLSGGWALTLFTCTLGGRTRVTVRCEEAADAGRSYGLSI